jgi:hypothetical protein
MATYTDNFNRAGPGLGTNWSDDGFGWDGLIITSNEVENDPTVPHTSIAYWDEDGGAVGDDAYSEVLLSVFGTAPQRVCGAVVRYTTSASVSTGYVGGYDWDGNDYQRRIFEWNDGGTISLATEAVDIADNDTIRLEADGSTLTLYINDTQELQTTDSTYTTGYIAMAMSDLGGQRLDDWEGGDVVTGNTGTGSLAVAVPAVTGTAAQELTGTGSPALATPAITGTGTVVDFTLDQEGYRWRDDDANEATAAWLATQDTDVARAKNQNTRLRVLVDATGDPDSKQYQLEYRKVGGGTWMPVEP